MIHEDDNRRQNVGFLTERFPERKRKTEKKTAWQNVCLGLHLTTSLCALPGITYLSTPTLLLVRPSSLLFHHLRFCSLLGSPTNASRSKTDGTSFSSLFCRLLIVSTAPCPALCGSTHDCLSISLLTQSPTPLARLPRLHFVFNSFLSL